MDLRSMSATRRRDRLVRRLEDQRYDRWQRQHPRPPGWGHQVLQATEIRVMGPDGWITAAHPEYAERMSALFSVIGGGR